MNRLIATFAAFGMMTTMAAVAAVTATIGPAGAGIVVAHADDGNQSGNDGERGARPPAHTPPPTLVPEVPAGGLLFGSLALVGAGFFLMGARRRHQEL